MIHPRHLLAEAHIEPKKSLGQNFLSDQTLLQKIINSADVQLTDHLLEVGPGVGMMTELMAQSAEKVVAVELDTRLMPILHQQLDHLPNVQLIHGDILEQPMEKLFDGPYKVIANVPYYITGGILRHLLTSHPQPSCLVMTVQKEVATRLVAPVGDLSLLAISVQFFGKTKIVGKISAGAFWPRPEIDSAIIRIDHQPNQPQVDEKLFFRVVKAGFSQKRKQLKNNLRSLDLSADEVDQAIVAAGLSPEQRAETVALTHWLRLTEWLASHQKQLGE